MSASHATITTDDDTEFFECLFCAHQEATLPQILAHGTQQHQFELLGYVQKYQLEFYGVMKLINFIRTEIVIRKQQPQELIQKLHAVTPQQQQNEEEYPWGSESYLKPVLADDPFLFSLNLDDDDDDDDDSKEADEDVDSEDDDEDGDENIENIRMTTRERMIDSVQKNAASNKSQSQAGLEDGPQSVIEALIQEKKALQDQVSHLQTLLMQITSSSDNHPSTSSQPTTNGVRDNGIAQQENKTLENSKLLSSIRDEETGYFESYSMRNIHEIMLKDKIRTLAYKKFIESNAEFFQDKIVLDVGCGTAILSLFAAKNGAKHVIGVDAADIADVAREIVKKNGYSDRITIVKGKMEEVNLPFEKVDIIISEWMGYFLLFESMLPSVLFARDRYLVDRANVYPNIATMFIGGIECRKWRADKIDFWSDVYGFDMEVLVDAKEKFIGSSVEILKGEQLISTASTLKEINCATITNEELDFTSNFEVEFLREEQLDAFAVWFTTSFDAGCASSILLSTSPTEISTHWMQTVFRLQKRIEGKPGQKVAGTMDAKRLKAQPRSYSVTITYWLVVDDPSKDADRYVQHYTIE